MNRRELLQDQYEDAVFALLMDQIATIEGQEAIKENERLQNDPSAAIPEDLERRCMQTIRRHFAKQKARTAGRFTVKIMKRVAMAAGIAAILFTTAFAASETVRVHTLNLMIEVFETNTEFRFSSSPVKATALLKAGWLPEGYTLSDQGSDAVEVWLEYQDNEKRHLTISRWETDGLVAGIDTEDAQVENVQIHDTQAMLVQKNNTLQLLWTTQNDTTFISIVGTEISREEIIHIANELHY